MTYGLAVIAFGALYTVAVLAPMSIILAVSDYLVKLPVLLIRIVAVVTMCAYLAALYRAHVAAQFVASGIGWFDAHQSSGAMTRAMLSALPIIGRLFRNTE